MATFKVGQRVRVAHHYAGNIPFARELLGCEGTIIAVIGESVPYPFAVDLRRELPIQFAACEIEPLTDGEADTWAADAVRKVTKPQHIEPVAPKTPVRVP